MPDWLHQILKKGHDGAALPPAGDEQQARFTRSPEMADLAAKIALRYEQLMITKEVFSRESAKNPSQEFPQSAYAEAERVSKAYIKALDELKLEAYEANPDARYSTEAKKALNAMLNDMISERSQHCDYRRDDHNILQINGTYRGQS